MLEHVMNCKCNFSVMETGNTVVTNLQLIFSSILVGMYQLEI
jgi:hypothetical protein